MNPEVFCEELIVNAELTIEELKSATKPLDEASLAMFKDSVRYLRETTQVLIDCLK